MEEPESVSTIINSVLREMGSQELLLLANIDKRWEEIVGEVLADKVRPLKISKGTLYLSTPSPVWSQEVLFAREMIKNRVKEVVGVDIQDIRTTQTPEGAERSKPRKSAGATETPTEAGANRDALATLQRAKESYERAKTRKSRR